MPKVIAGPIKVLQFIHSSDVTGPGRIVFGLAANLDRREFLCEAACPEEGALSKELKNIGIKIIPFEAANLRRPKELFILWKRLKKEGCHILNIQSGQYSALWKILGRLAGIPAIVYTEHMEASGHIWIKNKLKLFLHLLSHPIMNSMVDKIIAVSEDTRLSTIHRQGMAADKVVKIYNGVFTEDLKDQKTDCAKVKSRWKIPEGAPIVGMVSRLSPEKGHRFLILAAKEVLKERPDTIFLIAGGGGYRSDIEALIDELGVKGNFILTGFVENAYELIDCMDIVVQPSIKFTEAFGLSLVEAMAKAKPVIASDIECFKEIVEDGKNGFTFPSENHHALAEKIKILLKDGPLREDLGRAGQKRAEEKFDVKIMAGNTAKFYKELLKSKGYMLKSDRIKDTIDGFIKDMGKEPEGLPPDAETYRVSLGKYINFIGGKKLNEKETAEYLEKENNLLIDKFSRFLTRNRIAIDKTASFNNAAFVKLIRKKAVTSKDYDERIKMQTLQFQINNYYEPKDDAQKRRIEIVLSALKPAKGDAILDVGCGVGTFAYHSAKAGARAYGIDYSEASIETAKKLADKFGLADMAEYRALDAAKKIPYEDGAFDKIVAADFIEHIDDNEKKALLSEMARVLKPEGFMVIFTPNALREKLGYLKAKLESVFGIYPEETRLHYGLIDRFKFEKMMRGAALKFERRFFDVNRPYLARIPVLKEALSLNILWIARKI